MKLSKVIIGFLLLSPIYMILGQAPLKEQPASSEDYYMFPIRPNQSNSLAGNMGELRTSHFHAGLDIRTGGSSGLPVYAAADGYISRISITAAGYGKALYISHPNGEITVYAHLESFNGEIAQYTKLEQYKQQTLHLKLFPEKGELRVKKGDIIALSGNSGSSGGPHLHFEIRDKNHTILNPLKYNFEEIKDTTPPIIQKLAVTPLSIDARADGVYARKEISVSRKSNRRYIINDTVTVFGDIGFELLAFDRLDAASYKCGISQMDFFIGDEQVFKLNIDSLTFAKQRNILTHYNYPVYIQTGKKYHKLYVDDGNELDIYTTNSKKGKFKFEDNCIYNALLSAKDIYGNEAILEFTLKCMKPPFEVVQETSPGEIEQYKNTLIIHNDRSDSTIQINSPNGNHYISPVYASMNGYTFLWDLDQAPVESVDICDSLILIDKLDKIPSGTKYEHFSNNITTQFGRRSLFDTIYYHSSYQFDSINNHEYFQLGNPKKYPLQRSITVSLRPEKLYDKERTYAYLVRGKNYSLAGGSWQNDQFEFSTKEFGKYTLLTDSVPPTIKPIVVTRDKLKFKIDDGLSGIKEFNTYINNEWVLMDYDYKTQLIWSEKLNLDPEQPVEIRVVVTDNVKNTSLYNTKL